MYIPTLSNHPASIPDGFEIKTENISYKKLEKIIAAACKRFNLKPGVEIHLLTEGLPATGANTSGAIAATVSACLLWASDVMSKEEFENLAKLSPEDIACTKAEPEFQKRLRKAKREEIAKKFKLKQKACFLNDLTWTIEGFAHGGKASGYGAIAGVAHCRQPFCFFPERRSPHSGFAFSPLGVIEKKELECKEFNLQKGVKNIKNVEETFNATADAVSGISFSAFKLDKFTGKAAAIRKTHALPFTWGVIHSGRTKNTAEKIDNVEKLPQQRWEEYKETRNNIMHKAGMFKMVPESRTAFAFLGKTKKEHVSTLRDPLRWEMIGLGTEMLPAMRKAMETGETDKLAACMRRNESLLEAMGLDWYEGRVIADTIYQAVKKENYEKTAVKLTGGGGGGCVVFVAPEGTGGKITKKLQELQSQLDKIDIICIHNCSSPNFQFGAGLAFKPKMVPSKPREQRRTKVIRLKSIDPDDPNDKYCNYGMVGRSQAIEKIYSWLDVVVPSGSDALIRGETGTGKEILAQAVHDHSDRRNKRFAIIDCAGLPETLLESELFGHIKGAFTDAVADKLGMLEVADGGTVFIDEVQDASLALQGKLRRFLDTRIFTRVGRTQPRSVDVRCIIATSEDLKKLVKEGRIKQDFYFRINRSYIELPPLRKRGKDIEYLTHYFLKDLLAKEFKDGNYHIRGFTEEVRDRLQCYNFPGNVRELRNILHDAIQLAGRRGNVIEIQDLRRDVIEYADLMSPNKQDDRVPPADESAQPAEYSPEEQKLREAVKIIKVKWVDDELKKIMCMIFLFRKPDEWLKKHKIKSIFYDEEFRKFAEWLNFPLPDKSIDFDKDLFTPSKYNNCMTGLRNRNVGWLRLRPGGKKGPGTEYGRGENWLDLRDSGNKQATDK